MIASIPNHQPRCSRHVACALWAVGIFICASCSSMGDSNHQTRGNGGAQAAPALPIKPTAVPKAYDQTIPDTTVSFHMIAVPGDGKSIKPFFLAATEVTWDMYDLFVYGETNAQTGSAKGADAVTRPSKPYMPPDRGFGHAGYAALSMSFNGAQRFCDWLSQKTGHRYRLPTEAEWAHACALDSAQQVNLGDTAWFGDNADDKAHPVGSKAAGALGLHDMAGNAAEWVMAADGKPMTCGGSYRDDADQVGCAARRPPSNDWNASDPQLPKSKWWLADCTFVGFRVVCEAEPGK